MLSAEQAFLACKIRNQEALDLADRQRLVRAARLQRRAVRRAHNAQRATQRAAAAAAQAQLAWSRD